MKKISLISLNYESEKKLIEYRKNIFSNYGVNTAFLFPNYLLLEEKSLINILYKFPTQLEFEKKISYKNDMAYIKLKTNFDFIKFKYIDGIMLGYTNKELPELDINLVNSINYGEAIYSLNDNHSEFSIIFKKHISREFRS